MATDIVNALGAAAPPATLARIETAEAELGFRLPETLREVLLLSDGVGGFFGKEQVGFVSLCSLDEMLSVNRANADHKPRQELIAFGGDGIGGGYFFDFSQPGPPVLQIEWISDWENDAVSYAKDFDEFIEKVKAGRIR